MTRILLILCALCSLALVGCAPAYAQDIPAPAALEEVGAAPTTAPAVATIPAATVPNPDSDLGGYVSSLVAAAKAGKWLSLVALLVVGLVFLVRRFGRTLIPWLATDRGGVASALVCSFLVAVASGVLTGSSFGVLTLVSAVETALVAVGGFAVVKKLIWPSDAATK